MRRLWMTLPAVLLAALLVIQPVLAAAPASKPASVVDIGCEAGVCRFELDLGTAVSNLLPPSAKFLLQVVQDGLIQLPNGASVQVRDNVLLTLPMGTLVLPDADLTLEFGPDRRVVAIHGTALTPVPTLGLLDGWQWVTPARLDVGFEPGANLTGLQAPLDPERRYFHLTMEAGLSAISRGEGPGLQMEVPSGQRITLLVDPLQPLLYVNGQVNLRYTGGLAFVRELVDPAGALAWWPTGLALPQTIELGVDGIVGQGVTPNLELNAGYRVESGLIGEWLRLDGALVEAKGSIVLGPDGLVLAGEAHSALIPQSVANSDLGAQLYIPFEMPRTPVAVSAQVAEPAVAAGAATRPEAPAIERQQGRLVSMAAASHTGLVTGADTVAGTVAGTTRAGYGAVVKGTQHGIGWVAGTVRAGVRYTNEQWCAITGHCEAAVAVAQDRAHLPGAQAE
ncbi:MAG: hypothetical protein IT329_16560 [Caldilineaceae bacterium]|nr:hypothetical protein [Caldilineaceae bacterium]